MLRQLFVLPLLLFAALSLKAQSSQSVLDDIAGTLVSRLQTQSDELLFAHIDKPYHVAGGTIWFRIYLMNAQTHSANTESKIIYVDLVNERDSVIRQVMLSSKEWQLSGGLELPATLPESNYYLRMYTGKLAHNDPENIFIYPLYVVNTRLNRSDMPAYRPYIVTATGSIRETIRFVPEGGTLINGVDNTVAIRALDSAGNALVVSGYLKDSRDSVVTSFQTSPNGLGKIVFNPYKGRRYTAIVKRKNQPDATYELPAINNMGFQLTMVRNDEQSMRFRVNLGDVAYARKAASYILGVSDGKLAFAGIGNGMYEVDVLKKNFAKGIAAFYLFDEKKQLVSHRKVWIDKDNIAVNISSNKNQYYQRSVVKLNITITDAAGKPLPGIVSVSVTDDNVIPADSISLSPAGYVLLRNSLAGMGSCVISNNNFASRENIDLVLLTDTANGMESRSVGPVSEKNDFPASLSIRGKILTKKDQPLANQSIGVFSWGNRNMTFADTTNNDGLFHLSNMDFYDSTLFLMSLNNSKYQAKDLMVKLDPITFPRINGRSLVFDCTADTAAQSAIRHFKKSMADTFLIGNTKEWLQKIVVTGSKGKSGAKKSEFTRMITREQLSKVSLSNTANAVMMVPGVVMLNGQLTIRGGIRGVQTGGQSDVEPLVVVDGVQAVSGSGVVNYLNSIPPEFIESIEVFTGPEAAIYGTRAGNGVILVKTSQPPLALKDQNTLSIYPNGYHISPSFYMPDYDIDKIREAEFRDNRSTIYWNGGTVTDKDGVATIEFYTADVKTTYTVTVMGVSNSGAIIYKKYSISRQ